MSVHHGDQQEQPNEDSTLTYRLPVCSCTDTVLRLNGGSDATRAILGDNTISTSRNLHEVHDNRYGEGLNLMWIYLLPEYNYLLVR